MKTTAKVQELIKQGHKIFTIAVNEIWYTDKDDGKLRCIYKRKI